MAWRILSLAILLTLAVAIASSWAGPVAGTIIRNAGREGSLQVPSARDGAFGEADMLVECRANQRTTIVIRGDHKPVADLELLVFEVAPGNAEGKLVAGDKGKGDVVGAVWIPQRTAMYRVIVRNPAPFSKENPYNECYVSIR
jgi:hypothetical protein